MFKSRHLIDWRQQGNISTSINCSLHHLPVVVRVTHRVLQLVLNLEEVASFSISSSSCFSLSMSICTICAWPCRGRQALWTQAFWNSNRPSLSLSLFSFSDDETRIEAISSCRYSHLLFVRNLSFPFVASMSLPQRHNISVALICFRIPCWITTVNKAALSLSYQTCGDPLITLFILPRPVKIFPNCVSLLCSLHRPLTHACPRVMLLREPPRWRCPSR